MAFQNGASNLVGGDTNNSSDVFVHVLATGATTRASYRQSPNGPIQAFGASQDPALSYDAQFLAYVSSPANLVDGDRNASRDVSVLDRTADVLVRASVDSLGVECNAHCFQPVLSADGKRVAFESFATNLVPADTNGVIDVFTHHLVALTTERANVAWNGAEANNDSVGASMSHSGDRIGFMSAASNLVPDDKGVQTVYVRDLAAQTTERWGVDANDSPGFAGSSDSALSADGRTMAFASLATLVAGDANGEIDAYHRRCGPTGFPYCPGTSALSPCGNGGTGGAGCASSGVSSRALLEAEGMPRVSLDTVVLRAHGLPATAPILFFQGTSETGGGSGLPFGDGLRCAGGTVVRLGTRAASGGSASFGFGIGFGPGGLDEGRRAGRRRRPALPGLVPRHGALLRGGGFNFTN